MNDTRTGMPPLTNTICLLTALADDTVPMPAVAKPSKCAIPATVEKRGAKPSKRAAQVEQRGAKPSKRATQVEQHGAKPSKRATAVEQHDAKKDKPTLSKRAEAEVLNAPNWQL